MILPDLKHQLLNVFCGSDNIILKIPIEITFNNNTSRTKIIKVVKRNKSYKILDNFDNLWTISRLPKSVQSEICDNLQSIHDPRHSYVQRKIINMDTIFYLTKIEILRALREGKRVQHRLFSDDEWIQIDDNTYSYYVDESGYKLPISDFWRYRQETRWNNGWRILED